MTGLSLKFNNADADERVEIVDERVENLYPFEAAKLRMRRVEAAAMQDYIRHLDH